MKTTVLNFKAIMGKNKKQLNKNINLYKLSLNRKP